MIRHAKLPKPHTLALLLSLMPFPSAGQNVVVDENVFRVTLHGEIIGREDFSIRRVGMGRDARVILRGSVELDLPEGRRHLSPALEASGGDLSPTAYQLKISGSRSMEVFVSRSGSRFLAKVISSEGEQVREFRAGPGSILLDDLIAHQHHLLLPYLNQDSAVSLSVLSPRTGTQVRMTLMEMGPEEVRVGTELVQGTHFRLEGGEGSHEIWFDDQGRILRVAVPARGYVAERESL